MNNKIQLNELIKRESKVLVILFILICVFSYRLLFFNDYFATSYGGDSPAHIGFNYDYCQSGLMWRTTQTDKFYYPQKIDMALMYDHPILNTLTCPVGMVWGPIAQFNFLAFLQILFCVIFSYLYAAKHFSSLILRTSFVLLFCCL